MGEANPWVSGFEEACFEEAIVEEAGLEGTCVGLPNATAAIKTNAPCESKTCGSI